MVVTEITTNCFVLLPSNMVSTTDANGLTTEVYNGNPDPWVVWSTATLGSFAALAFLLAFLKMDQPARSYAVAWGLYYCAQGIQKAVGLDVAPLDWPFDAAMLGAVILGAYLFNRFRPQLKVIWSKRW